MENKEPDKPKLEISKKKLNNLVKKSVISEYELMFNEFKNDISKDEDVPLNLLKNILQKLVIGAKDELLSPSLKRREKAYKKYIIKKINLIRSKIDNDIESQEIINQIEKSNLPDNTIPKKKKEDIQIKINELIKEVDPKKNWTGLFCSETDFKNYCDILVSFYTDNNFKVPKIEIRTKLKTVGKFALIFKGLHEHFSEMRGHLLKDTNFHLVVKILHEWKDKSSTQIYKSIYKG